MLNGTRVLSKLNPVLASIAGYAVCTGAGFILWIAMGFLDLAVGTHVLEAFFIVMERLNEHVLPALQLLNRLFSPLVGFSILLDKINININFYSSHSRPNRNKISTMSSRFKMIGALPKGKYDS